MDLRKPRAVRGTLAQALLEVSVADPHLNRPGLGASVWMRNPDFIGGGAVDIVGTGSNMIRCKVIALMCRIFFSGTRGGRAPARAGGPLAAAE